jgi:hypothetical protein
MTASAIFWATVRFVCWEAALFAVAIRIARLVGWRTGPWTVEFWLAVVAIQVTLESSIAAAFSFAGVNSQAAYWIAAGLCLAGAFVGRTPWSAPDPLVRLFLRSEQEDQGVGRGPGGPPHSRLRLVLPYALIAALLVPLVLLSFKPVEEIDSINYLHYLIEWLSNRATPYTFATNYVAFWELSFAPVWMVTRVDVFFPLLALKAVVLTVLGLWLVGRQLCVPRGLLVWTVFGSVVMQHYWYGPSGVPTLKNDVLHGVGFVLMTLVILRAAERRLRPSDVALLAFGVAFGAVKYTGIFVAAIAIGVVLFLRRLARHLDSKPADSRLQDENLPHKDRQPRQNLVPILAPGLFFLLTSGHYYLHNLLRYGSPFYPFQINLGVLHLPGTADLSNTSILYSLHDPRLWRALFLPVGGVSPAGLLFPLTVATALAVGLGRCAWAAYAWLRRGVRPSPLDWVAFFLLCGWFLYFRSVFSASAYSGDLAFILNGLNSIRYVDGVLAVSELFLVALVARFTGFAVPLVAIHLSSRLVLLYGKLELFRPMTILAMAALWFLVFLALRRRAIPAAALCLVMLGPFVVERNREGWTTYWNDLKPAIRTVAGKDLAELALPDGGYFAGHLVAVGSPADMAVRSLLPEEIAALPAATRPRYLLVLVAPGSEVTSSWESRYGPEIGGWGYQKLVPGKMGALFERAPAASSPTGDRK